MEKLKEVIGILFLLLDAGCVMRGIFCFIKMNTDADDASSYEKRLKNMVFFLIIANSIYALVDVIKKYY